MALVPLYQSAQNWAHIWCGFVRVEVKDHLHQPAVNTPPKAAQAANLPCHMGTLMTYGHLAALSCKALFQLVSHHHVKVHGIITPQIWDLVLSLLFRCVWPSAVISPGFSGPSEIS